MFDMKNKIEAAKRRIRPHIRETSTDYSIGLSKLTNTNVYLKGENLQYTGSFKVRGAFNKLLSLSSSERQQGVVAASSGNHGAAVAFGMQQLNISGVIFVPENAASTKIDNIRNYDASLEFKGTDCMQTEIHAREYAQKHNMVYISPYNDIQVLEGQGTIGFELTRQLEHIDAVFVPIGGGGLISGIASYLKAVSPTTQVIGCLPENSPVMYESIKANKIIEIETTPTISDATAGGVVLEAITFDFCKKFVDDYVLVSEQEIKNAIISLLKTQHLLVEGASGVAMASLVKKAKTFHNKNVVVVLSGANISLDTLKEVIC